MLWNFPYSFRQAQYKKDSRHKKNKIKYQESEQGVNKLDMGHDDVSRGKYIKKRKFDWAKILSQESLGFNFLARRCQRKAKMSPL